MSAFPAALMSSAGTSVPIIISLDTPPYTGHDPAYLLGLICTVSAGANLTYSVQITGDQQPKATGNWNNHDIVVSQGASINSFINYPVTGVRLNVTAYTSGSVNLSVTRWP